MSREEEEGRFMLLGRFFTFMYSFPIISGSLIVRFKPNC